MELEQLLNQVVDRASFFTFVAALVADKEDDTKKEILTPSNPYGRTINGWENRTIERYLGAALSWAEDTDMGQTQGISEELSWKAFAVFLYAGKIYE